VCPSYLDGDHALDLEGPNAMVIPVRTPLAYGGVLRWHDCAVFKVRGKARAPMSYALGRVVFQNSTAWRHIACAIRPGPVDIRYRVELEPRGMRSWPSPALQVLELP
jgi:hypothetical protein